MPYLAGISLFPFKSLAPLAAKEARLTLSGALEHDREFAFFDGDGKFVNGKRSLRIHSLHSAFEPETGKLSLQVRGKEHSVRFYLPDEQAALEVWLSEYFGKPITVRRCAEGFPDDQNAQGPTLISTATLETVASWFPGLSLESARIRFRTNLEIGGVPPFWEDQLFGAPDTVVPFQIGEVTFHGINPCQRCIVPPRDPETGEGIAGFSQIFQARREALLPPWANSERFNHFYRLAVNTRVPESETGKTLRIGDPLRHSSR